MKKLSWFSLLVALALGVCLFLRPHAPTHRIEPTPPQSDAPASNANPVATAASPVNPPKVEWVRPAGLDEEGWRRALSLRQFMLSQNKPAALFAQVIDQDGKPVAGATLKLTLTRVDEEKLATPHFLYMNIGSELTNEVLTLSSDNRGWLTFTGRSGKMIAVDTVEKEGYLWHPGRYVFFDYEHPNGPQDFKEPSKGYVFHLWTKGIGERLIHIDYSIGVDRFGTNWYALNLLRGGVNTPGEADFRFWLATVTDSEGRPMRRFRFEAFYGGLVVNTNPYPYMAPTSGYASEWEWTYEPQGRDRTKSADEALKRVFYLSARNGKIYAAITWDWPSENSVRIVGYANPNGSRNLGPDPAKQITDPEEIRRLDLDTSQ